MFNSEKNILSSIELIDKNSFSSINTQGGYPSLNRLTSLEVLPLLPKLKELILSEIQLPNLIGFPLIPKLKQNIHIYQLFNKFRRTVHFGRTS